MSLQVEQDAGRWRAYYAALEDAVVEWGAARTALMKASADGQGWDAELVSRLTATEDMLMVFRRRILERDPAVLPGDYSPDYDFG